MIKDWLTKKFCSHKDTEIIVFYCNECDLIPVIRVYKKVVCRKCGKVLEKTLVSKYPSCYYELASVERTLQKKGVLNAENVLVEQAKTIS